MPIRPENRHHYGKAWKARRLEILARAENRCECTGECDSDHNGRCDAPNRVVVWRSSVAQHRWLRHECGAACLVEFCTEATTGARIKPVKIILTIAHLNHEAGDDRPENLKAMCQRCHLRLDRHQHAATAARTRAVRSPQTVLGISEDS